ncbi:MAG: 3'-5' exoribonuclease [Rhizobiales bacterium]|nr:3'-5' exoribonuclease [Hyphomicrobiales bacterium]
MKKYTDLMLDIETLDTRPTAEIIQIGAVLFNAAEKPNSKVITFIANTECNNPAYTTSQATMDWWAKQSDAANESLNNPAPEPIVFALTELEELIKTHAKNGDLKVWAKGADFDFPIIKHAFEVEFGKDIKLPWQYHHQNCCRTLFKMFKDVEQIKPDTAHNAKYDALAQAQTVQKIYAHLAVLKSKRLVLKPFDHLHVGQTYLDNTQNHVLITNVTKDFDAKGFPKQSTFTGEVIDGLQAEFMGFTRQYSIYGECQTRDCSNPINESDLQWRVEL